MRGDLDVAAAGAFALASAHVGPLWRRIGNFYPK
jgi:hypothetical protein